MNYLASISLEWALRNSNLICFITGYCYWQLKLKRHDQRPLHYFDLCNYLQIQEDLYFIELLNLQLSSLESYVARERQSNHQLTLANANNPFLLSKVNTASLYLN